MSEVEYQCTVMNLNHFEEYDVPYWTGLIDDGPHLALHNHDAVRQGLPAASPQSALW